MLCSFLSYSLSKHRQDAKTENANSVSLQDSVHRARDSFLFANWRSTLIWFCLLSTYSTYPTTHPTGSPAYPPTQAAHAQCMSDALGPLGDIKTRWHLLMTRGEARSLYQATTPHVVCHLLLRIIHYYDTLCGT